MYDEQKYYLRVETKKQSLSMRFKSKEDRDKVKEAFKDAHSEKTVKITDKEAN